MYDDCRMRVQERERKKSSDVDKVAMAEKKIPWKKKK